MKKAVILKIIGILSICIGLLCAFPVNTVLAADAVVIFGSDTYEQEGENRFPVGVYIEGDVAVGNYRVEIEYNPSIMRHVDGGNLEREGLIVLEGTGSGERVREMLSFEGVSNGSGNLTVSDARVSVEAGDGEMFNITEMSSVPININGITVAVTEATTETTEGATTSATQAVETVTTLTEESRSDRPVNSKIPFVIAGVLLAALAAVIITIVARKKAMAKKESERVRSDVQTDIGSREDKIISEKNVQKVGGISGDAVIYHSRSVENGIEESKKTSSIINSEDSAGIITGEEKQRKSGAELNNSLNDRGGREVVIDAQNVSMTFKITDANASGLKDYAIQKIRGKAKRRELKALDNISFKVYQGEVLGIIGTNGSGKSTLVKIISGALKPTGGRVVTDTDKVQLLTLGTGFDGELSAKENVYLNGAIIGYTKEFIDEHYDEIVEFAELKGFMDEKVKNFSSGMRARLGFSIATVGDVAEILILDEALSVGDRFFKQKSLERVQKMIHGGSTVLIVSHGMGMITEHCDRAMWIEKGVMKAIGDPKEVCHAYTNKDLSANNYKGLVKFPDGNWYYTEKGEKVPGYSGVAKSTNGKLFYVSKGQWDKLYCGAGRTEDGELCVFKKGMHVPEFTGAVKDPEGKVFFWRKGKIDNEYTGLAKSPDGKWYFMRNGIYEEGFTGITKSTNGKLYYAKDGTWDKTYNGRVKTGNGTIYVIEKGKVEDKITPP